MEIAFLIGRIILGIYYIFSAVGGHFMQTGPLTEYAKMKNVPAPRLAVLGSGLLLLVGGLSFLTGIQPLLGVICVVLFLVPVAFFMHNFWSIEDPQQKQAEMSNFMKDLGLAASALMFLAIPVPWPLSF